MMYIPMSLVFMYLVAIMNWHSRNVLSFKLSNKLDADFCLEALKERRSVSIWFIPDLQFGSGSLIYQ